jgi:LysM repeat protein
VVQKGENLSELSARYRVSNKDILDANPQIANPDQLRIGQTLTIPLDRNGAALPALHTVQKGETLSDIARANHSSVGELQRANNIHNPDMIYAGEQIWVPGAGGKPNSGPNLDPATAFPLDNKPALSPQAQRVDDAVKQVQSAQTALDAVKASAAHGNGAARADLRDGYLQQSLSDAQTKLNGAINDEITASVGADADDARVTQAGQAISARYAGDPAAQKLVSDAVNQVRTDRQVRAIVGSAQTQTDPAKALQALNQGYASAPQNVKDALLRDPDAQKLINDAAAWANQPLTQPRDNATMPQAQTAQAIQRLDQITQGLDKNLAGAVVDAALPGYEKFRLDNQNVLPGGSPFGSQGMTTLMNLSGRIAGTTQGDDAVSRFAAMDAWNGDSVRNAIAAGTDPAYAIELAHQFKENGVDPSIVVQTINDGVALRDQSRIAGGGDPSATIDVARRMQAAGLDGSGVMKVVTDGVQQFKDKVAGDVKALAEHDAELSWLVKNDGAGMTPQQLNAAVNDYRAHKGAGWNAEEARLRQQIADDGTKLTQQLTALNQLPPQLSGSQAKADATLKAVANDPSAELAISTAIQTNPSLADAKHVKDLADVFVLSKVGDVGKKYANELASAYLRRNVLDKLNGVDLSDPASVANAKQAIESLRNENFGRLIGVSKSDLDKAVNTVQKFADQATATGDADQALKDLSSTLDKDAALSKTFNKTTLPGQLLRGVGVVFAGASLLNSYNKAGAGNFQDPQADLKLLLDSAGFAQKNVELLVGLGAISKESPLGQFGGEWKLAGRASASDLIAGVSAVLDGVSAVRSGFGLGVPQDTGSAIFSATTAVGGALTVAPAFGAAAWLGPVGLGVTAVGVVGKAVYDAVKDAHKYEGASRQFLTAAGYDAEAADVLSKQDGILSGASGSAQLPFLAKYAEYKHMTPEQLKDWVNSLTPDQVSNLSKRLLQTAGDSNGEPSQFTDGPAQQKLIVDYSSGYAQYLTLANTVGVFENYLNYDHVPHP